VYTIRPRSSLNDMLNDIEVIYNAVMGSCD